MQDSVEGIQLELPLGRLVLAPDTLYAIPLQTHVAVGEPVTVVVLTGTPAWVAKKMLMALAVSAQKPSMGRSLVIFWPMVLTMRQPPNMVPSAIAR